MESPKINNGSRRVELQKDSEVNKYKVEDLVAETRQLTDFSPLEKAATKEDLAREAAKIRAELEKEDREKMSPELRQAVLKVRIDDLEDLLKSKYSGFWSTVKELASSKFRMERAETVRDLQYSKDAIRVLAAINGNVAVLPKGVEAPAITEVEKVNKEVEILIKMREELEERLGGQRKHFLRATRELGRGWMGARDDHRAKISEQLGIGPEKRNNFSIDDYFNFLEIEQDIVRKRIAFLYHKMEGYLKGDVANRDLSGATEIEVQHMLEAEDRKEILIKDSTRKISRVTGGQRGFTTLRQIEIEMQIFTESKERFFEKKILDYIEANRERISKLADTSIFLEVQTHLAEIDEKNPKFELSDKYKLDLAEAFRRRVAFSACKEFGATNPHSFADLKSKKIDTILSEILDNKIAEGNFQERVTDIIEKCYGRTWANGEVIKPSFSGNASSIKAFSGGVAGPASFATNSGDPSVRELHYFINDNSTYTINGVLDMNSWWPHPLGIVIMDPFGNLLLNGTDLIESSSNILMGRRQTQSTPQGIMWVNDESIIYLNGKKVGNVPLPEYKRLRSFVGLSKKGLVVHEDLGGVGDEYAKLAGVYVGDKKVAEVKTWYRTKAVVSSDFSFVVSDNFGGRIGPILIDGKYPIKLSGDAQIEDWWVHPRGVIVLHKNREFRFYSFEAVAKEIRLKDKFKETLTEMGFETMPKMGNIRADHYGPKLCWFNKQNYENVRTSLLTNMKDVDEKELDDFLAKEKQEYTKVVQDALAMYYE